MFLLLYLIYLDQFSLLVFQMITTIYSNTISGVLVTLLIKNTLISLIKVLNSVVIICVDF